MNSNCNIRFMCAHVLCMSYKVVSHCKNDIVVKNAVVKCDSEPPGQSVCF